MRPTRLCWSAAAVAGTTALGVAAALADPALAGHTPPHPALVGKVADATSVFIDNARVLSAPYLLWILGAHRSRAGRVLGDVLLGGIVVGNTVPVGLELGRWQTRLIPYVPQLPIEWTALAIAVGAWLAIRSGGVTGRMVLTLAAGAAALLAVAAALETWDTPHPARQMAQSRTASNVADHLTRSTGTPGTVAFATDSAPAAATPLQGRALPLPSRCSVPLGHPGRCKPGYINHPRTPDRRDQKMNNIALTGRLASDVQTRSGSNSTEVARLRLAVQRPRGKDGEDKGADFIDVTVFGRAAQVCAQYLTKGRKVAIEGHLHHSEWDSPDGRRQKLEVHARNVEFLDRGKTNEPGQPSEAAEPAGAEEVAAA